MPQGYQKNKAEFLRKKCGVKIGSRELKLLLRGFLDEFGYG